MLLKRLPNYEPPDKGRFSSESVYIDDFSTSTASTSNTYERELKVRESTGQRIINAELKVKTIKRLKKVIHEKIHEIERSKPIVTARWQPALPT